MSSSTRGRLLRILRDHGPATRSELSRRSGLARTTLAGSLDELVASGLVEAGPIAPSSGGRPSSTLRLATHTCFLAVSLGESKARVVLLDSGLTIGARSAVETRGATPDDVAVRVGTAVRRLLDAEGVRPLAVGLAAVGEPGVVRDRLDADLGVPVVVETAAHAMALGEGRAGAARGVADYLAVRLGAGVTSAAVVDAHLARGSHGRAGAIGHVRVDEFGPACSCGATGCLDAFVSDAALLEQATRAAEAGRSPMLAAALEGRGRVAVADLLAAVAAGDPTTVQLARDAGRRLGGVVATLVAAVNPRRVVLGGPLSRLGPQLLSETRSAVYRQAPADLATIVSVELSELGERAVLIGAAQSAGDGLFDGDF